MNKMMFALYIFSSVAGLIFFKFGANEALSIIVNNSFFEFKISWISLLGLGLYILSFLIYMGLVSKTELTYLIPISAAVTNVLIILSSVFIFNEHIKNIQLMGISLILIGVFLTNCTKG